MENNCIVCVQGLICFVACSPNQNIVLMCDECHTVWLCPENVSYNNMIVLDGPSFMLPGTNMSLKFPEAHWAVREEVKACGWEDFIAGECMDG